MDAESWHRVWSSVCSEFDGKLAAEDTDAAWALLSDAAEDALGSDPGGLRRSQPAGSVHLTAISTKAPTHQSIKERRLRRLAGRVREFLRGVGGQMEQWNLTF